MLVSFKVSNWISYSEEAELSMTAGKERQHGTRVPNIKKYKTRILPIAVFYGGNSSGKTNFFRAINFAKFLITKGVRPDSVIPVEQFKLKNDLKKKPTQFCFVIYVNEKMYEFSFSVTQNRIITEKLVEILATKEYCLYERKEDKIQLCKKLKKIDFMRFAAKGTRENQLFLTNTISQKINNFEPIFNWFRYNLILISPEIEFAPFDMFFEKGHPLYKKMKQIIPTLGTGISGFGEKDILFENLSIPTSIKNKIKSDIKKMGSIKLQISDGTRIIISSSGDELIAKKLVTYHKSNDGKKVIFELEEESDGTRRLFDILPIILELSEGDNSSKTFIVDELDRSWHSLLTHKLIKYFLDSCNPDSRSQLLFTTHDLLLLDQEMFRRDEMWVVDKEEGSSRLVPLSNFPGIRNDKILKKNYLQGRFGGIPTDLLND